MSLFKEGFNLVQVEGGKSLKAAISSQVRKRKHDVERSLLKMGDYFLREAGKITPVATGELKDSRFKKLEKHGFYTTLIIGYTAWYAAYVHERLDLHHEAPTQAKFLEQTLRDKKEQGLKVFAKEMDRVIETGPGVSSTAEILVKDDDGS